MTIDPETSRLLREFLAEDLGRGDITSEAVIGADARAAARVLARQEGIVAGLREAEALAELAGVRADLRAADGDAVEPETELLLLRGNARAILGLERTLLNLVSQLSGVATLSRRAVEAVASTGARVAATRKTIPGLRLLQKRAAVLGGADAHRHDLGDGVLIKDNHLALVGDVAAAVRRARERAGFVRKIEIEVETTLDAVAAAEAGADILLLDNMTPAQVAATIDRLKAAGLRERVLLEASGGVTLQTARSYAQTGVDVVSLGALTASAPPLDCTLIIEPSSGGRHEPEIDSRRARGA